MSQDVKAAKLAKLQKQFFDLSVEAAREEVRRRNEKIKHSLDMEKQERILQNNLDLQRMIGAQQEARERAQSRANAKTQRQNMMMGIASLVGQGALALGTGGASLGLGGAGALGTFGKVAAGASAVGNLVGAVGNITGNREMAQAGQLTGALGQFGGAMGGLMNSGAPAQGGKLTPEQRGQLLASGGKELTSKQMTAILNKGGPEALNKAMQGNAFAIPQQTQQQGQHPNAYFNQMYNNPMIEGNNYIGRQIMQGGEDGGFSFKNALLLGGGKVLQEIGDLGRFTYETEAGKHAMATAKSDAYRRGTDLLKTSYDRDATYENTGRVNQAAMEREVYSNEQQNRRQREKFELDKLLAMADHLGKKNLLAYEHNLKKQETKKSLENIKGLNSYLGSVLGSSMSDNQKTEIVNSLLPSFINSGDNRFMGVLGVEVNGDKLKMIGAKGVQPAIFDVESVLQATGSNEGLQTYYKGDSPKKPNKVYDENLGAERTKMNIEADKKLAYAEQLEALANAPSQLGNNYYFGSPKSNQYTVNHILSNLYGKNYPTQDNPEDIRRTANQLRQEAMMEKQIATGQAPQQRVVVKSPNGIKAEISSSNLQQALDAGYVVVK